MRFTAVNTITWMLITPSFVGLLLVQKRLSELADDVDSAVSAGEAGPLIVELL